ncbi:MAG TPA: zf-HC2 domain-containing protein [bacterium]|nr:zf-HC2 domain-containing protein [bacterium]
MNIHNNTELLSLYMDGKLDKGLAGKLEAHMKICRECRETFQKMAQARCYISTVEPVEPTLNLEKEILENIHSERNLSLFPSGKFSLALGALAAVLFVSLLFTGKFKKEDIRLAMTPEETPMEEEYKSVDSGATTEQTEKGDDVKITIDRDKTPDAPEIPHQEPVLLAKSAPTVSGKFEVPADKASVNSKIMAGQLDESEMETPELKKAEEINEMESPVSRELIKPPEKTRKEKSSSLMEIRSERQDKPLPSAASVGTDFDKLPSAIVIRDNKDWNRIWMTQNAAQNLSLKLPEVDFSRKMVVAIPSREAGREYSVVNTVEEKDRIVIQFKEQSLQKPVPPPYQINVVNQKPTVELQKLD